MSYLLEILGRGLLADLGAAFREPLADTAETPTRALELQVEKEPTNPDHQRELGIRYLHEQKCNRARNAFLIVLKYIPSDKPSRIGVACALDDLGMTQEAIGQLQTVLKEEANDAPTRFAVGFCFEKIGDTTQAIQNYEAVLDIEPRLRNAHERLAAVYLKIGDVSMAITHYEHLCWCEPQELSLGLTLASLYFRAKRFDEAIREYERVIMLEPDNWDTQNDLVTACVEAERYEDAIDVISGLIEKRPECADQFVQLGDLYIKMGNFDGARDAYTHAVDLNPDYLEATIKLGTAKLRDGQYIEAADAFNQAIEINDRIVNAYCGLSIAQMATGRIQDAEATLSMAGDIEPNSTLLFSELARLQLVVSAAEQKDQYLTPSSIATNPEEALDPDVSTLMEQQVVNIRAVLKDHPNHADLHYRLGLLLRHLNDLAGAIDHFWQAVTINPQYQKAMTKLAIALRESGNTNDAVIVLKRAIDLEPESIDLHYQLGLMFSDRNEFALALSAFELASEKSPKNLDYLSNVALALQNMGLLDRATAAWRTLCEVAHESDQLSSLLDG